MVGPKQEDAQVGKNRGIKSEKKMLHLPQLHWKKLMITPEVKAHEERDLATTKISGAYIHT